MRTINSDGFLAVLASKTAAYKKGGEICFEANDEGKLFNLSLKKANGDGLKRANAVEIALNNIAEKRDDKAMHVIALLSALLNSSSKNFSYLVSKGLIEIHLIEKIDGFYAYAPSHYRFSAKQFVEKYVATLSADARSSFDTLSDAYKTQINPFGMGYFITGLFAKPARRIESVDAVHEVGTELKSL